MKSIKGHLPDEGSILKETLNFHYCPDEENGQRTTKHYTTQSALAACTVYEKDGIALTNMTPQQKSVDTFAKAETESPFKSAVQVEVEKSPGYTTDTKIADRKASENRGNRRNFTHGLPPLLHEPWWSGSGIPC